MGSSMRLTWKNRALPVCRGGLWVSVMDGVYDGCVCWVWVGCFWVCVMDGCVCDGCVCV